MSEDVTHTTIEAIARNSYGQLIAYIAALRFGDVAEAEDALERSIRFGAGEMACGWRSRKTGSVAVAGRAQSRRLTPSRHNQVRQKSEEFLRQIAEEAESVAVAREHFPDERLKLLFRLRASGD